MAPQRLFSSTRALGAFMEPVEEAVVGESEFVKGSSCVTKYEV